MCDTILYVLRVQGTNMGPNCAFYCHRGIAGTDQMVKNLIAQRFLPSGTMMVMARRKIKKDEKLLIAYNVIEEKAIAEDIDNGWVLGGSCGVSSGGDDSGSVERPSRRRKLRY
jgi:hypothetical protein